MAIPNKIHGLITRLAARWETYCNASTINEKTKEKIPGFGRSFAETDCADIPGLADDLLMACSAYAATAKDAEFNRLAPTLQKLSECRTRWLVGGYDRSEIAECFSQHPEALMDFQVAREAVEMMLESIDAKAAQHRPGLESIATLQREDVSVNQAAALYGVDYRTMSEFYDAGKTPEGYVSPAEEKQRENENPQSVDGPTRIALATVAAAIRESRLETAAV